MDINEPNIDARYKPKVLIDRHLCTIETLPNNKLRLILQNCFRTTFEGHERNFIFEPNYIVIRNLDILRAMRTVSKI